MLLEHEQCSDVSQPQGSTGTEGDAHDASFDCPDETIQAPGQRASALGEEQVSRSCRVLGCYRTVVGQDESVGTDIGIAARGSVTVVADSQDSRVRYTACVVAEICDELDHHVGVFDRARGLETGVRADLDDDHAVASRGALDKC